MVVWKGVAAVAVCVDSGRCGVGARCGEDKVAIGGDLTLDMCHELGCGDGVVVVVVRAGELVGDPCDGVYGVVVYGDGSSLIGVFVIGVFVMFRNSIKPACVVRAFCTL